MTVDNDTRLGTVVAGRYRLDRVIGRGGMSTVYRGTDTSLGRVIAVKAFRSEFAEVDDLRRQRSEVELLASVNHPALVTLFDAVTDGDGALLLIMELVDGPDLRGTLARGPIGVRQVSSIGADVAAALAHIHARGIVHRDVKPANVLVPDEAHHSGLPGAKLADFGIARLVDATRMTSAGSLIGTADYLSPEQALGHAVGPASDVYSLGLVLIECLTGQRSFSGTAVESAVARLHNDPAIPESVDIGWRELLTRMTARDPSARPGAAECGVHLAWLGSRTRTGTSTVGDTGPTAVLGAAAPDSDLHRSRPTEATDVAPPLTGASTQYLAPGAAPPAAPVAKPQGRSPRRALIVAAAIVLLGVLGVGAFLWSQTPEPAPAAEYPAVEGELGSHLEQLQQSVEP